MATKIKKNIGHDRMTFTAIFDNGDNFKFNISRSRDSYSISQLKIARPLPREDFVTITNWLKCGADESHIDRYTRAEAVCSKARSLEGLAMLVSLED